MSRITNEDKHARIERVFLHLRKQYYGIGAKELAHQLKMNRRTVDKYLVFLESKGRVYKEGSLWFVDYDYVPITLKPFHLEAEEAMVLYLASRLFVKASDRRNIAAETVLEKLAQILQADADVSEDIAQAATQLAQRPMDENYEDIFQTIMQGYLHRRSIEIVYHPYNGDPFQTTIRPYLLEPSAIGFSTYIIGHSSIVNNLRTYKVERISRASLTRENYLIPQDFPGLTLLENAWSIFYGDETIAVTLRFHPDVARRVRETYWHPSQEIVDDPDKDGYILLGFEVANTTDLTPWIRTWGANCEVLEPESLRDTLMGEARRFAELYGWHTHRGTIEQDEDDLLGLDNTLNDFFGD